MRSSWVSAHICALTIVWVVVTGVMPAGSEPTELVVPHELAMEHADLHAELARTTDAGGRTAEAARALVALLHPHLEKEETYALPPLALLPRLAKGEVTPAMRKALAMTDKLEAELDTMLAEHRAIVAGLDKLAAAAKQEGKIEVLPFVERLKLHVDGEETVLYPAALLVGRYLRLKLPLDTR